MPFCYHTRHQKTWQATTQAGGPRSHVLLASIFCTSPEPWMVGVGGRKCFRRDARNENAGNPIYSATERRRSRSDGVHAPVPDAVPKARGSWTPACSRLQHRFRRTFRENCFCRTRESTDDAGTLWSSGFTECSHVCARFVRALYAIDFHQMRIDLGILCGYYGDKCAEVPAHKKDNDRKHF